VIVRKDADPGQAAESIVRLCYHNQGQDCSAPNAILVDRAVSSRLFGEIYERTLSVEAAMSLGRHSGNVVAANYGSTAPSGQCGDVFNTATIPGSWWSIKY